MNLRRMSLVLPAAAAVVLLCLGASVLALINKNFTPNDLVEQTDLLLVLNLKPADEKGMVHTEIVKGGCLKGEEPETPPIIDTTVTALEAHAKSFKNLVVRIKEPALFFVGRDEQDNDAAFLHFGGKWYRLDKGPEQGGWDLDQMDSEMEGTFAGSTDMFLKMLRVLIEHAETRVPCDVEGCEWDEKIEVDKLDGRVHDAQAVDLDGKGRPLLYIAAEKGDRIYRFDAKAYKFEDATAKLKLAARSRAAAWGDLNADGRLDLASYDGEGVSVCLQNADGTFAAPKAVHKAERCLSLSTLDVGAAGRPGILVGTPGAPVLLVPGKDGGFTPRALKTDAAAALTLGAFGRCLVADFDGDRIADVLQPAAKGGLFFKGRGKGSFDAGSTSPVALGAGRTGCFLGDWDHDGLLDVFAAGEDYCRLWHNQGRKNAKGQWSFIDMLGLSGEIAYISQPGSVGGGVCDINSDGLQDVFITYGNREPQFFFNRGFRSFGHAHEPIDLNEAELMSETEGGKGQQAGVVADLTDDGAQDMAVVLAGGEVWVFPRAQDADFTLCVRVALPLGKGYAGPLVVTGQYEHNLMGAWNVVPGTSEAFFSLPEEGDIKIRWQLPGGKVEERKLSVGEEKSRRRIVISGFGGGSSPRKTPGVASSHLGLALAGGLGLVAVGAYLLFRRRTA